MGSPRRGHAQRTASPPPTQNHEVKAVAPCHSTHHHHHHDHYLLTALAPRAAAQQPPQKKPKTPTTASALHIARLEEVSYTHATTRSRGARGPTRPHPYFFVTMCPAFPEAETRFRLPSSISYLPLQPASERERNNPPQELLSRLLQRLDDVQQGNSGYIAPPLNAQPHGTAGPASPRRSSASGGSRPPPRRAAARPQTATWS